MNDKYKDKYRTTPARLTGWDYGSHGLYFITICTKDRVRYFGEIEEINGIIETKKTPIGHVAFDNWLKIPEYSPFVELDEFVIMPDHIHCILFINKPDKTNWQPNQFGSQSKNLASIIRGYKSSVTQYAILNGIGFTWQAGYYDRVIRNEQEYQNIQQYIYNNPEQWLNGDANNENFLFP